MALHKITDFYAELFSVYPNIISKFRTIAIFNKNCVKQNNDSNKCPWSLTIPKFICLSATVHELSPQNKLWILTFKRPPCSYFLFLTKTVLLKVVHPLKIYQYTTFYGPTLTGTSLASTSDVWTSVILEWLKVRDYRVRRRGHLQWHDLSTEFHKNLPIGSKVIRGDTQTDWWSHKPHFPFWGKYAKNRLFWEKFHA
jgi:hypothetical protein